MEETKMSDVVEEIKGASEEELREVIEKWLEDTRTQGMHIGAQFISAAVLGAIEKNLTKGLYSSSLRDCQRALKRVIEIVSVQLKHETVQNDLVAEETVEETPND
jgi:anti-anti-sigma regulatory factor